MISKHICKVLHVDIKVILVLMVHQQMYKKATFTLLNLLTCSITNTSFETWLPKHFIIITTSCCLQVAFNQADIYWFKKSYTFDARQSGDTWYHVSTLTVGSSKFFSFSRYCISLCNGQLNTFLF